MLAGDPTEASEKAEEFLKERSLSSYGERIDEPPTWSLGRGIARFPVIRGEGSIVGCSVQKHTLSAQKPTLLSPGD